MFFIYNNDPSYKDGEHWRLMMKMSKDQLFCFDSFGSSSFNQQIPLPFLNCSVIFENATVIDSNECIETLSLNYNEVNLTIENFKQNIKQNTQFYYFTKFLRHYSTKNNLQNVLISYNRLPYQKPSTVLCGAWCAYFAWRFFIDIIYKYKQEYQLTHFKYVLKTHFEESVYLNLPFKIYVKETFLKYCDPIAKHAFLIDLEEQKFEFKDTPNTETPLDVGKMVAQETNILKNNQLNDVVKHFDLLRTQENLQSTFINSKDLSKLPVYWLNKSVNTPHQNEQLVSLQKRMI